MQGQEENDRVCVCVCAGGGGFGRDGLAGILTISSTARPLDKATPWGNKYPVLKQWPRRAFRGFDRRSRGRIYARVALKRRVRRPIRSAATNGAHSFPPSFSLPGESGEITWRVCAVSSLRKYRGRRREMIDHQRYPRIPRFKRSYGNIIYG